MQAGQLRSRVTLQALAAGADTIGQPVQTWADAAVVWANVRYLNGLETIKGGAEVGTVKASVRIRYRAGITTAMRVINAGVALQITAVLPDAAKREFIDLVCEAIQ